MRLEIELEQDATAELIRRAIEQRRPIDWEAEVLLRHALGLAFSSERCAEATDSRDSQVESTGG
jgi:hypothetical protein